MIHYYNPNVNQKFKIKVDLPRNLNKQAYSPYANRFLVYKGSIYKFTIQEQLKVSVSLIYDKLKAKQHSLKEVQAH